MTHRLGDGLRRVEAFRDLDETALQRLSDEVTTLRVGAGERLIRQGDVADAMYIVLEGRLGVTVQTTDGPDQIVAELSAGAVVGEVALVAGTRRSASVQVLEDAVLATVSGAAISRLLASAPAVAASLADLVNRRLRQTSLASQLAAIFDHLDGASLAAIEAAVEWVDLPAGQVLFRQGETGDAAYLVVSGRLRVTVADDGRGEASQIEQGRVHTGRAGECGDHTVAGEVAAGELVGELALLTGEPRTATVRAVRDSELACLPGRLLEDLALLHPPGMLGIIRTVVSRQALPPGSRRHLPEQLSVMVVPATAADLPFVQHLADAMAVYGSVTVLSSERVRQRLLDPGVGRVDSTAVDDIRLRQWLADVEASHHVVLYVPDAEPSAWTSRCLRQADVIVRVADGASEPCPPDGRRSLVDAEGNNSHTRRLQILLHPSTTPHPRGTSRWLPQNTDVEAVHHVRRGHQGDMGRVARIIAGRAVSVVLSGGGARAFAHLGVLDALAEVGIPVDFIGGTSMGSIMALAEALEVPRQERVAKARAATDRLLDYTLPVASMVSGRRVSAMLERFSEGLDIEDLWVPFFCLSTSLTTSRPVVHRRGSAARAVRASISIPGVMPPVPVDGQLLVDGGLLDNLPVTSMRRINPTGPIIASDVVPPVGPSAKGDWGPSLSGWRVLASRLPGRAAIKIPSLSNTLLRSTVVASARLRDGIVRERLADCYIDLDVRGMALLDFDGVATAARVGYEGSLDRLRDWWEASGGL